MAIIATGETRALVQGITGTEGRFRTERMLAYGTKIVAGVTPGKEGQTVHGVPVYDTIERALDKHPDINAAVQFVPAPLAKDASLEVIEARIPYLIIIAEGVPFQDAMEIKSYADDAGTVVVGPNSPGVISPGICELGATAHVAFHGPGKIGVISTTGSVQWYMSRLLSLRGWGQSTFVGIGGDPCKGTDFDDALRMFERDEQTEAVLMVGEIGGTNEERAAKVVEDGEFTKPLVAFIYGRRAPRGKRMGHAGAIVERGMGTVEGKVKALTEAGAKVITYPWEVVGAFEEFGIKPIPELIKKPIHAPDIGK
jgi:succinyl-CoA synthetase alpha subunit